MTGGRLAPLPPGTSLGGYELGDCLSRRRPPWRGVYRASGPRGPTIVKLLGPEADPVLRELARAEAELGRRCRCPQLSAVERWVELDDGHLLLAGPYAAGQTLWHVLDDEGPLEAGVVASLLADVARACQSLHDHGVVHGDLSPANVLIGETRAWLLDLGTAARLDEADWRAPATLEATPAFCAPELLRPNRSVEPTADVYGFGAVLVAAVTGAPPWSATSREELLAVQARAEPPHTGDPTLDRIIRGTLAYRPAERYSSMLEVLRELAAMS